MKNSEQFERLGWIVAAALGTAVLFGFQGSTNKVGFVDVNAVALNSDLVKANDTALQKAFDERMSLLNFVQQNPALQTEKLPRLKDLWLTPTPTPAQVAELERIKTDGLADTKRANDVANKEKRSVEEQASLDEYNRRRQYVEQRVLPQWSEEFENKLQGMRTEMNAAVNKKAREAVTTVGRTQGCSIVFSSPSALFGANDLTEAATKSINGKQ